MVFIDEELLKLDCSKLTIDEIIQELNFKGHANTVRNALKRLKIQHNNESIVLTTLKKIIATGDSLKNQSPETISNKLKLYGVNCHVNTLRIYLSQLGIHFISKSREKSLLLMDNIRQDAETKNLTVEQLINKYPLLSKDIETTRRRLTRYNIDYRHEVLMVKALKKDVLSLDEKEQAFLLDIQKDDSIKNLGLVPIFQKYGKKHNLTQINIKYLLEKHQIQYRQIVSGKEITFLDKVKNLNTQHMTLGEIQQEICFNHLSDYSFYLLVEKFNLPYLDHLSIDKAKQIDLLMSQTKKYTIKEISKLIDYQDSSRWIRKYLIKNNYVFLHTTLDIETKAILFTLKKDKHYTLKQIRKMSHYVGLEASLIDFLITHHINYTK